MAFRLHEALGTQEDVVSRLQGLRPTRSRTYASATALPRSPQGSLPAWVGWPLTGRGSHPLDDTQGFMTYSSIPLDRPAWPHYATTPRNDDAAAEAIPGAIGRSGSTVSRGFIQASAAQRRALQARDLAGEDVVVVVLDGKTFADATMVIALGLTLSGEKRFLGFVETDTEHERVLTPFLRSLVARGLDVSQGTLVILDGGDA